MEAYSVLQSFLDEWKHLPSRRLRGGTLCVGPTSRPDKLDFLFRIHSPLLLEDILKLERELELELNAALHIDLKKFYLKANGFMAFSASFSLYGLRRVLRSGDDETLLDQPFDLIIENQDKKCEPGTLKIGGYREGSRVFMEADGRCFSRSRDSLVTSQWSNMGSWLESELHRIARYLNREGRPVIPFSEIPAPGPLM